MKNPPANLLKRLLNPVAARAKRYLISDLQSQLEIGLEKLNRATQHNSGSIQTLAARIHSLDNSGYGMGMNPQAFDSVLNAAHILEINTHIAQQMPLWQACDSILTCPIMLSASNALFPKKTFLHDTDTTMLLRKLTDTKVKTIGITSPWLFLEILKQPHGLHTLLQACSRDLLFFVDAEYLTDQTILRQALHRVGFYNVSIIKAADTEDFISTGCLATGEFLLTGSEPALPKHSRRWNAYRATRTPDITAPKQYWSNLLPKPFQLSSLGFTAEANGSSLALCTTPDFGPANTICINARISWSDFSLADHASLVGCYHGPGDTKMYAAMVQLSPEKNAIVSLWVNHGTWERLEAAAIPAEIITSTDGVSSLPIWLEIAAKQIKIGSENTILIDVKNDAVQRTSSVGIRVSGNTLAVSNIQSTVSKPCT